MGNFKVLCPEILDQNFRGILEFLTQLNHIYSGLVSWGISQLCSLPTRIWNVTQAGSIGVLWNKVYNIAYKIIILMYMCTHTHIHISPFINIFF